MDSLYESALNIVRGAQPTWDGGIFDFLLNKFLFPPNGTEPVSPLKHVVNRVSEGGYAAGLSSGIIWIFLLLIAVIFLSIMHCQRKKNGKAALTYKMVANRMQKTHRRLHSNWACASVQFILLFALVFLLIIGVILGLIVIFQLHSAVGRSPNAGGSGTGVRSGVFPRLMFALDSVHGYLLNFGDNAKRDTSSVVEDIIVATERMQNETTKEFNAVLMKRIGVEHTFKLGDDMAEILFVMFDHSGYLQRNKTALDQKVTFLDKAVDELKIHYGYLTDCGVLCENLSFLVNKDSKDITFKFASSFIYMMKQEDKSKESILKDMSFGKQQVVKMMDKMYLRSKSLMQIPDTIRNMTNESWHNMSIKMTEDAEKLSNISHMLSGKGYSTAVRYESISFAVCFIALLVLATVAIVSGGVIVHFHCAPGDLSDVYRNRFKVSLYVLLFLVIFVVFLAMALFLTGGIMETEACRYLRPDQPRFGVEKSLYLDRVINKFLDEHWSVIEKKMEDPNSNMPTPRPRNVLHGITSLCRRNDPLLVAIDAVDSIDPKALDKPELSAKFVGLGRFLMHEQLNESDPSKMQPPGIKKNLQDALQLGKFTKNVSFPLLIETVQNMTVLTFNATDSKKKFSETLARQYFSELEQKFRSSNSRAVTSISESLKKIFRLNREIESLKKPIIDSLRAYEKLRPIVPIIQELIDKLDEVNALMMDKPRVIGIADKMFTEIIEKTTPAKARAVMAKYGPKMMGALGRCRPVYDAYDNGISAICTEIAAPLNGIWFFLGWGAFIATPLLALVLALLTKKSVSSPVLKKEEAFGDIYPPNPDEEDSIEMVPQHGDEKV